MLRALQKCIVELRVECGASPREVQVERHIPGPAARRESRRAGVVRVDAWKERLDVIRDERRAREGKAGAPEL
jgi:hypothetical protein